MELDDFQKQVFDFVKTRPSPGCHCAVNAFRHLRKAWRIRKIDPEMAYFRSCCAEEEAATAIIQSLKRLHYPNADKLNYHNHVHKASVIPFIWAINNTAIPFHEMGCEPMVEIKEENGEMIIFWSFIHPDTKQRMRVDPPFNLVAKINGQVYDFAHDINLLKDIGKTKEVIDYLRKGANNRNLVLYSASNGIGQMRKSFVVNFVKEQYSNVTKLLLIYLLIDTYPEHQSFVQQCLNAFIKMLRKIPEDTEIKPIR